MALQVWLPLNGDLRNQGVSDVTVTNNGATVNSAGKIGSCYKFGTSASYMDLSVAAMSGLSEASVCFWLYINSFNTSWDTYFQAGAVSTAWTAYTFGLLRNDSTSKVCFCVSNGSSATQTSCISPDLTLGKWYHFTLTYKSGHILMYINGELHQDLATSIVPNFASISRITIGKSTDHSNYQTDCSINDVRIYDHCLSTKEVKEISLGLVLHYKLNDPYIESTTNLNSANWSAYTNYWTIQSQTIDEIKLRKNTSSSSDTVALTNSTLLSKLSAGDIVTVSGYLYKDSVPYKSSAGTITTYTNQYTLRSFTSYDNGYFICTITVVSPSAWEIHAALFGDCNDGDICYIRKLQWEKKDHATPYTLSSRNETTITDSSGFGYSGTILWNNAVSNPFCVIDSTGGRYSKTTEITDSSCYIQSSYTALSILNNCSVSWWYNPRTIRSTVQIMGQDGNYYIAAYNASRFYNNLSGTTAKLYVDGIEKAISSISGQVVYYNATLLSGWHHYCLTGLDLSAWTKFKVGGYGSSWMIDGDTSDVRVYNTVLSADDVKRLYSTSALIDKNANLECFETVENYSEKVDINKKGQTSIDSFVESDDYLYLPAGCYVDTALYYNLGNVCKAETIIRYASGGSGRDLMGFSPSAGGYWGVTSGGAWESHGTFSYTNSDISKLNRISYVYTADTSVSGDQGNYRIGCLNSSYTVRNKYIYNVKLYKNGVLERDLYPAHNASGNGLVDIVHNVFYQAVGSGTLTGNDGSKLARFYKGRVQLNQIIEI